jgi:CO/xanthine dehydrogenase Mo-binding subunit
MTDSHSLGGAARYAGSRVHRVEDPRLLTGRGSFVDDIQLPGMLHACFVRSPFPRARILNVDTSGAAALAGVQAVFVAADLNPGVALSPGEHLGVLTQLGKQVGRFLKAMRGVVFERCRLHGLDAMYEMSLHLESQRAAAR